MHLKMCPKLLKTYPPLILLIALTFLSCNQKTQHEIEVQNFRDMKNENFTNPVSSPLPKGALKLFQGLTYFEVDPAYQIEANFVPATIHKYVRLFENEDVKQIHVIRGTIQFTINEVPCSLIAYSSAGQAQHSLFIPFTDSHKNSYPGGRYLDGKLLNDSTCLLDFNLSYNPYCVYNEKFKCALVPKSNQLKVSVSAGEFWPEQID
jgi:uncharacterized protein (DUF1684 family)